MPRIEEENDPQVLIIQKQGAQGGGIQVVIKDEKQYMQFDEEVGKIPTHLRKDPVELIKAAKTVGVEVIDTI